jgi:hypothetical protein
MTVLENRYRRLLRWYPADHRRAHEEEMLGVLLADAGPERTRPSVRDALDLVWGGLGIRFRRAPSALARAGWRDAAALLSVIAPLALLADTLRYVMEAGFQIPMARYVAAQGESWTYLFHPAPFRFLWGLAAIVALCGVRRVTLVAVLVAVSADLGGFLWFDDYAGGTAAVPLLLGLVAVAAMGAGPGVARGQELLGRSGLAGIIVLLAVSAPLSSRMLGFRLGISWADKRMSLAIAALLAGAWLARSAAGRRTVVILAGPFYALVAPYYPAFIEDALTRFFVTMVVIPVAAGLSVLTVVTVVEWLVIRPTADRDRAVG